MSDTDWLAQGSDAYDDGDLTRALRCWIRGTDAGDSDCRFNLAVALRESAPDGVALPLIAERLASGHDPLSLGLSPLPLHVIDRPQWTPFASPDDVALYATDGDGVPTTVIPGITARDLTLEVAERERWALHPAGAHALAGRWTGRYGASTIIFIAVSETPDDDALADDTAAHDSAIVQVFTAVALAPAARPSMWPASDAALPPLTIDSTPTRSQALLIDAAWRLAETPPRDPITAAHRGTEIDPQEAAQGRRTRFDDVPVDFLPVPWMALGPTSWVPTSDGNVSEIDPQRLQLTCGYAVAAHPDHVRGALVGAIDSLTGLVEWLAMAFDESPLALAEIIPLMPYPVLSDHALLLGPGRSTP